MNLIDVTQRSNLILATKLINKVNRFRLKININNNHQYNRSTKFISFIHTIISTTKSINSYQTCA